LLQEVDKFQPHKTDVVTNLLLNKLQETTTFTPDLEEQLRVVKDFDSSLKYAFFTIIRDTDVGLHDVIDTQSNPTPNKSAYEKLMSASSSVKRPKFMDRAGNLTGRYM